MTRDPRPTQTKVKHEILQQYLQTWGGIITHGLRNTFMKLYSKGEGSSFSAHFSYVDCFSYRGRYEDEQNGSLAYGSPIIGIRELDKLKSMVKESFGFSITTSIILAEEQPKTYHDLLETLEMTGYRSRVEEKPPHVHAEDGQIFVLKGDYRQYIDEILQFTGRQYHWSFYFLDPFGARGLDLGTVSKIISQDHCDTIIYYPYLDIQKKSGSILADNPEHSHHKHLRYIDQMYGSDQWRDSALTDIQTSIDPMPRLVDRYSETLVAVDDKLAIKRIPLSFEDKDRTLYYLFLSTHDGTGALRMNEILDMASIKEFDYRSEKRTLKPTQQLSLFSDAELSKLAQTNPNRPTVPEVDLANLSNQLAQTYSHSTIRFRDLLKVMADSPYYVSDIQDAIKRLKKGQRVEFEGSLRNSTLIQFH